MLLNSVILVLQETLEAALLISVLLSISRQQWQKASWVSFGLFGGLGFSILYANQMVKISEWFDYVGQEILNATIQISIALLIAICVWAYLKYRRKIVDGEGSNNKDSNNKINTNDPLVTVFTLCAGLAVALAITREGSEILLYINGSTHQANYFQSVMTGGLIGFGIGSSIGVLLYYGLLYLPQTWRLRAPMILLALFAGNMLSQAALQLTQANWAPSTKTLWDSSAWIPENSISGQLLYALIGYEATPSLVQIISYLSGVLLVIAFGMLGNRSSK